jgi:hypothetical protein
MAAQAHRCGEDALEPADDLGLAGAARGELGDDRELVAAETGDARRRR